MSSRPELKLDWCSHEAAKYAIEHWHYSRCLPSGRRVRIGVWESEEFRGVILFGDSISPNLGHRYGLSLFEVTELTRIALRDHQTPVTKMLSVAIKMLRRRCPYLRLIVSFADSAAGHHGGIYQAGNWVFVGTSHVTQWFVRGKWRNDTSTNRLIPRFVERPPKRLSAPKYKYVYPLDGEMRQQIEPLRQPCPRCAGSVDSDTPSDQGGKGGATPTSALSLET